MIRINIAVLSPCHTLTVNFRPFQEIKMLVIEVSSGYITLRSSLGKFLKVQLTVLVDIKNVVWFLCNGISTFVSYLMPMIGCPCGVMVKAMNCGIVVCEFVLQSRYYVHFWANTLGKGMNPLILPPAMSK